MASSLHAFLNIQRTCARHRISHLYSATPSPLFSRSFSQSRIAASGYIPKSIPKSPATLSLFDDDNAVIDLSEDNDVVNGTRPGTPPVHARKPPPRSTPDEWKKHKQALKERFPDGWSPPRKISRDAMDSLRQLHHINPDTFTTEVLAEKFRISPEAVRRILKSKWEPSKAKKEKLVMLEKEAKKDTRVRRRGKESEEAMHLVKEEEEPEKKSRQYGDRLTFV